MQCSIVPTRGWLLQFINVAWLMTLIISRANFPKYISKDKIADFLESYVVEHEICIWLSSTVASTPVYDSCSRRWTIEVQRGNRKVTVNPKHLVLATGSGSPRIPPSNGMDDFQGVLYHSDYHRDAEQFRDKRIVVIGAVLSHLSAFFLRRA